MQLRVGNEIVSVVNQENAKAALEDLRACAERCHNIGVDEGDMMKALSSGLKELNPFSILTSWIGGAISVTNTPIVLVLVILGTFSVINDVKNMGEKAVGWLEDNMARLLPWLGIIGGLGVGAGAAYYFFKDEGRRDGTVEYDGRWLRAGLEGLGALFLGFLPRPVAAAVERIVSVLELPSNPSVVAALSEKVGNTVAGAKAAIGGMGTAARYGGIPGIGGKIVSLIDELVNDGKMDVESGVKLLDAMQ